MKLKLLLAKHRILVSILIAVASAQGAAIAKSYEAWYSAATDSPKSTTIPSTVHTFYDGKLYYSKTRSALGDTIGFYVAVPCDPATTEFAIRFKGKPLGKKSINGKECQGYRFFDPIESRDTENWFDDGGKLYYQSVETADTKYQQTRTDFKVDPESSKLTSDPDITSNNSGSISETVPYNADESPFVNTGTEKTKFRQESNNSGVRTRPTTDEF